DGARSRELNRPAAYAATLGGGGIGGSDDHAGIDIGRTWTEGPAARTPAEFLASVRAGGVSARGAQGRAAKWGPAAIALAARALGRGEARAGAPDPAAVMRMLTRLLHEAEAREGAVGSDLGPEDARYLLRAWLGAVELDDLDPRGLIA